MQWDTLWGASDGKDMLNKAEVALEVASDVVMEAATMHRSSCIASVEGVHSITLRSLWCGIYGVQCFVEGSAGPD